MPDIIGLLAQMVPLILR